MKLLKVYAFSMSLALLVLLAVAAIVNLFLPIGVCIYTENFMWLLLYLAEPLLVFLVLYANALTDILYDWI